MGYQHDVTFFCNNCEQQYTIEENMEIPPFWLVGKFTVANKDGHIVDEGEYSHFCSQCCLNEYISSNDFKETLLLAEQNFNSDMDDFDDVAEN